MKLKTLQDIQVDFWKKFSIQNLFLKKTFSDGHRNVMLVLLAFVICFLIAGVILTIYRPSRLINIWIPFLGILPIFIFYLYLFGYVAKKELNEQGFKAPKNIFQLETAQVRERQIMEVYKAYKKVPNEFIELCIRTASDKVDKADENPFQTFEKFMAYVGKTFLAIVIALLLRDLYVEYSNEKFYTALKLIFGYMLLMGTVTFVWIYMFKYQYMSTKRFKRRRHREFVYILKNVLLLRCQAKPKKKK